MSAREQYQHARRVKAGEPVNIMRARRRSIGPAVAYAILLLLAWAAASAGSEWAAEAIGYLTGRG